MSTFAGLWPALVTPLTEDNHLNIPVLEQIVEYLLAKQVNGFYVAGTTGQGLLLSLEERKQLTAAVLRQVNGRVPVIVHVGAVAEVDAVDLARHACDQGASGISSLLLPQYPDLPALVRYVGSLSASVPIPFLAYIYGRDLDAVHLMECLMQFETVIGAKYTGPNLHELKRVIELGRNGEWTIFSGMDEQSIFAAMTGASGHIGSTLNIMPGVYRAIWGHIARGEFAQAHALQLRANGITQRLVDVGFAGALNYVMGRLGFDCGQPRQPHQALNSERRQELDRTLDADEFGALARM
ncbi:MAG: dihydrodipicolinate synthase family protein [Chloroflexi bacterium]|nr:dihydrodipicolinate synthase family protein [Chloroflexota bacterium]